MLKAISELSKVDGTTGVIVVESDSLDGSDALTELDSVDARRIAITEAAKMGLPDPRICGTVQRYPVDNTGEPVTDPTSQKVANYRADIPVTKRLV